MVNAIFAIDKNNGMGFSGSLPWPKDKEDLNWFKTHTLNQIVIMGSKTWHDPFMPSPLPNRVNVVISSKDKNEFKGANVVIHTDDLISGIKDLVEMNTDTGIWIIGGPTILHASKQLITNIYLTEFHDVFNCDVFLDSAFLADFEIKNEIPSNNKTFKILQKIKGNHEKLFRFNERYT